MKVKDLKEIVKNIPDNANEFLVFIEAFKKGTLPVGSIEVKEVIYFEEEDPENKSLQFKSKILAIVEKI